MTLARKRRLQVEEVLRLLPDVDDLGPLREALVAESRPDAIAAWTGARSLLALDKRVVEAQRLEERVPELAERVRERTERVLHRVVQALRALEEGDAARAAEALIAAGEAEEESRRPGPARRYYEKALEQGRKPRNRRMEGLALRRLGRVARSEGDLEGALRLYRQGWEVARAQRDVEGQVVGCQGSGNALGEMGRWEEAREWYRKGLVVLEGQDGSPLHWQLYNNLAIVEARLGHFPEAERWIELSAAVARDLGDGTAGLFVENAKGRLRMAQGRHEEAEQAFRAAFHSAAHPAHEVTVLVNLAEALLARGRMVEAEAAARRAEESAIAHRLGARLPDVYRVLGVLARERREADGVVFFEQALELCSTFRLPPIESAAIQHQYALFESELGHGEGAVERLRAALLVFRETGARPEAERAEADLARLQAPNVPDRSAGMNTQETDR